MTSPRRPSECRRARHSPARSQLQLARIFAACDFFASLVCIGALSGHDRVANARRWARSPPRPVGSSPRWPELPPQHVRVRTPRPELAPGRVEVPRSEPRHANSTGPGGRLGRPSAHLHSAAWSIAHDGATSNRQGADLAGRRRHPSALGRRARQKPGSPPCGGCVVWV